jgi:hypothetical protein
MRIILYVVALALTLSSTAEAANLDGAGGSLPGRHDLCGWWFLYGLLAQ